MQTKQEIVQSLVAALTFQDADISFSETDEEITITISVDENDSGILIGFHGEKINALQYLLTLMLNHESISFKPVNLDINQYHQKRTDQLHQIADSATEKAVDSGREILLPPMPAKERRIIHLYLDQNSDVSTYSEGEGSSRRIVIRPENT